MRKYGCLCLLAIALAACGGRGYRSVNPFIKDPPKASLELVAESQNRWTGIGISRKGRIFVCFPRWSPQVPVSVGEIVGGAVKPFPDEGWNSWTDGGPSTNLFVCVQSVVVDDEDHLWILDPASPYLQGVVDEGARIYKFELEGNTLVRSYSIPSPVAPRQSYLNDIRVDTASRTAYITDSGLGAIVVVDLGSGKSIRRLDNHFSTKAELDRITVEGAPVEAKIHADGISLSPDGKYLYYQALCARHLYKVPAKDLRDASIPEDLLESRVEQAGEVGVNDGILGDRYGNIFLSGLESNSINMLTAEDRLIPIVQDRRIQWPDTFSMDPGGTVYFSVAQLHLPPDPSNPYKIFRIIFDGPRQP